MGAGTIMSVEWCILMSRLMIVMGDKSIMLVKGGEALTPDYAATPVIFPVRCLLYLGVLRTGWIVEVEDVLCFTRIIRLSNSKRNRGRARMGARTHARGR